MGGKLSLCGKMVSPGAPVFKTGVFLKINFENIQCETQDGLTIPNSLRMYLLEMEVLWEKDRHKGDRK